MTPEQLKKRFVRGRAQKLVLTWGQLTSAITSASVADKAAILAAINENRPDHAGRLMANLALQKRLELATTDIDAALADGSLTLVELAGLMD